VWPAAPDRWVIVKPMIVIVRDDSSDTRSRFVKRLSPIAMTNAPKQSPTQEEFFQESHNARRRA